MGPVIAFLLVFICLLSGFATVKMLLDKHPRWFLFASASSLAGAAAAFYFAAILQ